MPTLSDFWHEGTTAPEQTYEAIRVVVFHCGHCGIAIDMDRNPSRCAKGHLNLLEKLK